jgi:hypothetical protein
MPVFFNFPGFFIRNAGQYNYLIHRNLLKSYRFEAELSGYKTIQDQPVKMALVR